MSADPLFVFLDVDQTNPDLKGAVGTINRRPGFIYSDFMVGGGPTGLCIMVDAKVDVRPLDPSKDRIHLT